MQYSQSPDTVVHGPTGHRMHQDTAAVTSEITAQDLNQVNWSLMELLNDQGILPAAFDPATPDTYQRVLQAIKKMIDTRSASPTIIDRSGATDLLLLDRFDTVHSYKVNGTASVDINTRMVDGGLYEMLVRYYSGPNQNSDILLRPNKTSYANQFSFTALDVYNAGGSLSAGNARSDGIDPGGHTASYFIIDPFAGGLGYDGWARLLLYPITAANKFMTGIAGDSIGVSVGSSTWFNSTVPWDVVGTLFNTNSGVAPGQYSIRAQIRRVG
jgi:hypothetical protein